MFLKIVIAIVILIVIGAGGKMLADQDGYDDTFNAYKIAIGAQLLLTGILGAFFYIAYYFPV